MKAVVIGLDGATFDIIDPMIAAGRLPVLKRLIENGVSGRLRSTLHPNSFPGWASCTTGTSEGMHGVYSPFIKEPGQYAFRAMNATDIRTKTVWELLFERGRRVGVINVPTTYPTVAVEGFLVTGMLTPTLESQFTYPAELRNRLLAAVPDYQIEPRRNSAKAEKVEGFRACMQARRRAIDFLLKESDWDFLMVVYSLLDRTQHDFWEDYDPEHHRHDPESPYRDFIPEMYERADEAVGQLLRHIPAGTPVLICSDHGFSASLYEVRMNEWLCKQGYLHYRDGLAWRARRKLYQLRSRVEERIKVAPPAGWDNALDKKAARARAVFEEIDWSRTRAFFGQDRGIWLNLKGREAEGIVEPSEAQELCDKLRADLFKLRSPIDEQPVFERVLHKSEAFSGRYAESMPDLIPLTRDSRFVLLEGRSPGGVIIPSTTTSGAHSPYGIFIASGDCIRARERIEGAHLRDIAPTALFAMNEPLTEDMDGRVLTEIFTAEGLAQRSLRHIGSSYKDSAGTGSYEDDEQDEIQERMRALGYIG